MNHSMFPKLVRLSLQNPLRQPAGAKRPSCSCCRGGPGRLAAWVGASLGLAAAVSLQATVLDSFSGSTQTGWTDTANGGQFTQAGGQLTIATAANAGALTYGAKTSSSFANAANQTLEFRVNVNTVSDPVNPVAILGWIPSGGAPGAGSSGYSLSVSSGLISLQQGATVLYSTNYVGAGTNVQNTNITLVLRMTPSGGSFTINARVYNQTGNQADQEFTEVFEYTATATDSAGTPGYAVLGVNSGASATGASVQFANLQVFVLQDGVLDNFSGGNQDLTNNWDLTLNHGTATISGGQFELSTLYYNNTIFTAGRRITPNYVVTDGSRLELSVDVLQEKTGPADPDTFAVLGYTPANNDSLLASLTAYHVAAGCSALYAGKFYDAWWVNAGLYPELLATGTPVPSENPGNNMRLIMTMTGEGTSCRVDCRVEDLNVGVNDPNRLLFQTVFVDTAGTDPMDGGYGNDSKFPQAYLNAPGSIVVESFYGGSTPDVADNVFANLVVNQTAPVGTPPSFSNLSPADGSNFMANTTPITFKVLDAVNTPVNNISLTLNGVTYTSTSPGVTISGTSTSRLFAFTNALAVDAFYVGALAATNSIGLVSTLDFSIDTFSTNDCYTVESEDWNFNSGEFYEAAFPPPTFPPYNNLANAYFLIGPSGVEGIDFHDSRTTPSSGDSTYRQEPPRNDATIDGPRAKYIATPDPGEVDVTDRQDGDWMDYTHIYPEGYFTAFMRMAQYAISQTLITLEQVTSDPTQPNQTTVVLGSFLGLPTGYDVNRNVPLTDAFGNPVVVYFNGQTNTLRINNQIVNVHDSDLFQNYFVFVPAATPGSLPPFVATVTPLAGSALNIGAANPSATIVNRTTSVNTNSILVQVNGATVSPTVSSNANGATVTWTPVGTTASVTNTLIFEDSASVWQTNSWTYTYSVVLNAAGALPLGSLTVAGLDARMVISSAANISGTGSPLNNSLASAQALLAIPPAFPADYTATNWVQNVDWGLNGNENGAGTANFPGLCIGPNISFAVEAFTYVQLTAGLNRFYIKSDDVTGIFIGTNLTDLSTLVIDTTPINTANTTFDFIVPVAGLYPLHLQYEQGGGGADCILESVNLSTGAQTVLNTAGGANAYYPLIVRSASSLAGPFAADTAANGGNVMTTVPVPCGGGTGSDLNVAVTGGTITFPVPNQTKFYVLDGPRPSKITSFKQSGGNAVITYQYQ